MLIIRMASFDKVTLTSARLLELLEELKDFVLYEAELYMILCGLVARHKD
jgi:hypothetical protein